MVEVKLFFLEASCIKNNAGLFDPAGSSGLSPVRPPPVAFPDRRLPGLASAALLKNAEMPGAATPKRRKDRPKDGLFQAGASRYAAFLTKYLSFVDSLCD